MEQNTFRPPKIKISGIQAVLVDIEGVVTNTERLHAEAWREVLEEYLEDTENVSKGKIPLQSLQDDYIKHIQGKNRYEGIKDFLEAHHVSLPPGKSTDSPGDSTLFGLANLKHEIFEEQLEQAEIKYYEDAIRKFKALKKRNIKVGAISSSKHANMILHNSKLKEAFDVSLDGIDIEERGLKSKPESDIFIEAARELGVEPERTIVLENSVPGANAAQDANFGVVVGINREGKRKALLENGADLVVKTLDDLILEETEEEKPNIEQSLPNAFTQKDVLFKSLDTLQPILFLDYDGTLSPIVEQPEDAILSDEMRDVLRELSSMVKIAVVSGRDMDDVKDLVNLPDIYYAGSHGFRISGPGGVFMQHPMRDKFLPNLDQAQVQLEEKLKIIPGLKIERKQFAIAVHYRNVDDKYIKEIRESIEEVTGQVKGLKTAGGKKIYELKPDIEWHKGKAVFWLIDAFEVAFDKTLPIYIGDDLTDEDAFNALADKGIGILVGDHGSPTSASYRLRNVRQVRQFIQQLNLLLEKKSNKLKEKANID